MRLTAVIKLKAQILSVKSETSDYIKDFAALQEGCKEVISTFAAVRLALLKFDQSIIDALRTDHADGERLLTLRMQIAKGAC